MRQWAIGRGRLASIDSPGSMQRPFGASRAGPDPDLRDATVPAMITAPRTSPANCWGASRCLAQVPGIQGGWSQDSICIATLPATGVGPARHQPSKRPDKGVAEQRTLPDGQ